MGSVCYALSWRQWSTENERLPRRVRDMGGSIRIAQRHVLKCFVSVPIAVDRYFRCSMISKRST